MGDGNKKIKKFVKGIFGKDFHTMTHSEFGPNTEFTVSKKRTKVKGPKGKEVYKGDDKKQVDTLLNLTKKKRGGIVNRYKSGSIIQHD